MFDEYTPVKALYQIYVTKQDGTLVFTATTLAVDEIEAVKKLAVVNSAKLKDIVYTDLDIYARAVGFPLSESAVKTAFGEPDG